MKKPQIVNNKSLLLKKNDITKHQIGIDPKDESLVMEVCIRDISFLDIQAAAQEMFMIDKGDVTMNLKGYWKFAFSNLKFSLNLTRLRRLCRGGLQSRISECSKISK